MSKTHFNLECFYNILGVEWKTFYNYFCQLNFSLSLSQCILGFLALLKMLRWKQNSHSTVKCSTAFRSSFFSLYSSLFGNFLKVVGVFPPGKLPSVWDLSGRQFMEICGLFFISCPLGTVCYIPGYVWEAPLHVLLQSGLDFLFLLPHVSAARQRL